MYNTFINGVQHVWLGISIFLLLILSFSRTTIFKNALTERHFDRRRLVLIYGSLLRHGRFRNLLECQRRGRYY